MAALTLKCAFIGYNLPHFDDSLYRVLSMQMISTELLRQSSGIWATKSKPLNTQFTVNHNTWLTAPCCYCWAEKHTQATHSK